MVNAPASDKTAGRIAVPFHRAAIQIKHVRFCVRPLALAGVVALVGCATSSGTLWSSSHLEDTTAERVAQRFRADAGCRVQDMSSSDYFSRVGRRFTAGAGEEMPSSVEQDWQASGCSKRYWYTATIDARKPGSLEITIDPSPGTPPSRSSNQLRQSPKKSGT